MLRLENSSRKPWRADIPKRCICCLSSSNTAIFTAASVGAFVMQMPFTPSLTYISAKVLGVVTTTGLANIIPVSSTVSPEQILPSAIGVMHRSQQLNHAKDSSYFISLRKITFSGNGIVGFHVSLAITNVLFFKQSCFHTLTNVSSV